MNDQREIRWEYWANPLGGGKEYVDDDGSHDDDDPPRYDDVTEVVTAVRPVVPTSAGLVPVNVYGSFCDNFNWWMMHTNFDITHNVLGKLKTVPGVETCDVISRYRARVGFAKCFVAAEVKSSIHKALVGEQSAQPKTMGQGKLDEATRQKVKLLEQQARDRYKHWAIYVIPNGEIAFLQSEDEVEYQRHLELFRESQSLAGGEVLTFDDR